MNLAAGTPGVLGGSSFAAILAAERQRATESGAELCLCILEPAGALDEESLGQLARLAPGLDDPLQVGYLPTGLAGVLVPAGLETAQRVLIRMLRVNEELGGPRLTGRVLSLTSAPGEAMPPAPPAAPVREDPSWSLPRSW